MIGISKFGNEIIKIKQGHRFGFYDPEKKMNVTIDVWFDEMSIRFCILLETYFILCYEFLPVAFPFTMEKSISQAALSCFPMSPQQANRCLVTVHPAT